MRAHEPERPVDRSKPLERADEDAQPGRVEELDPAQVDDDVLGALLDQFHQSFPQTGGSVDINFTANVEHRMVADRTSRHRQLHPDLLTAVTVHANAADTTRFSSWHLTTD